MATNIGLYSTALNKDVALEMANLCREAYKARQADNSPDEMAIISSLKQRDRKFQDVVGAAKDSAQAILAVHEDYYCMAFRGTDEWEDWLDNFDGRKANSEQAMFGDFHRGFHRSCNDVWDKLDGEYRERREQDKKEGTLRPLFLTGHSLGGAMATVAAAKLVLEDRPFSSVYTYGQPRVVKRATAQFMNKECGDRFYRFQNNQDIVTRVPSRLMGYSHVGRCLYIDADGAIHSDSGFWFRFLDFVDGAFDALREKLREVKSTEGIIDDHVIDRYVERMQLWEQGESLKKWMS